MKQERGFTLIEVLAVLVLLSVMLLLISRMISDARHVLAATQTRSGQLSQLVAAQRFLGTSIGEALPLPLTDARPIAPSFIGQSHRIQFVAPLPDVIGGGLYVHNLQLSGHQLWANFQNQGVNLRKPAIQPVLLLDHVISLQFEYQGTSPKGDTTGWIPNWPWSTRLPQAIRIRAQLSGAVPWTTQVVRLRMQLSSADAA